MSSLFLWVKVWHIVMVTSWMAGLFYMPRIFVNLALVDADAAANGSHTGTQAERARLLLMAGKLYKFMGLLMVLALIPGLALWLGYGVGFGTAWMPLKFAFVLGLIGYHAYCGKLFRAFSAGPISRSDKWLRIFNEAPVIVLLIIVILVVVKPF